MLILIEYLDPIAKISFIDVFSFHNTHLCLIGRVNTESESTFIRLRLTAKVEKTTDYCNKSKLHFMGSKHIENMHELIHESSHEIHVLIQNYRANGDFEC